MRKKKEDVEVLEYYSRTHKIFNIASGVVHKIFINVKDSQKVNENTLRGTRVLVARYPDFYKIYLYDYHRPGEKHYPYGGIRVWNAECGQLQSFYYDSVAVHPEHSVYQFGRVEEIDVDNLSNKQYSIKRKT
jgi:hypothetical protein